MFEHDLTTSQTVEVMTSLFHILPYGQAIDDEYKGFESIYKRLMTIRMEK